jgi:hypothetical protein
MMMHRITDAGRALLHEVTDDLGVVRDRFDEALSDEELDRLARYCTDVAQRFE